MTKEEYTQGRPPEMNVGKGMHFVARHPRESALFLSRMLYEQTKADGRFTMKMWLSVASHIIEYTARSPAEVFNDEKIIRRVKKLPLKKAVRLALRFPEKGTRIVAAVIYEELSNVQHYSKADIIVFVNMFIGLILEDLKRRLAHPDDKAP